MRLEHASKRRQKRATFGGDDCESRTCIYSAELQMRHHIMSFCSLCMTRWARKACVDRRQGNGLPAPFSNAEFNIVGGRSSRYIPMWSVMLIHTQTHTYTHWFTVISHADRVSVNSGLQMRHFHQTEFLIIMLAARMLLTLRPLVESLTFRRWTANSIHVYYSA